MCLISELSNPDSISMEMHISAFTLVVTACLLQTPTDTYPLRWRLKPAHASAEDTLISPHYARNFMTKKLLAEVLI